VTDQCHLAKTFVEMAFSFGIDGTLINEVHYKASPSALENAIWLGLRAALA
jgi:hypothetical protein